MQTDLSPDKILPRAIDVYTNKTKIKMGKLMILAFFAGVFVALACEASTLAASSLLGDRSKFPIGKLVQGLVFTPGLIFVILAGGELFTGNTLMTIPLLDKKISLGVMLRSWILVYFGNFIGALFVAFLLSRSGQWFFADGLVGVRTILIAKGKIDFSFGQALVLGLLGNFLVCLGVWMSLGAKSYGSKVISAFFPISVFVLSGFEHSIANMYYLPAGILAKNFPDFASKTGLGLETLKSLNISNMVFKNLFPVTLGNIIGGTIFIGTLYFLAYRNDNKD
ncbi:formate/nitrite transporter [Anaerococcus lactolyticus ATCC 51172]|uniref:Formate/nitrite transporter n=1 Tax=Anaerococcus lactolyticus ATCC 51172 TaxID=525254 RepID=C2BH54_9FIRM|nr:formate/nitrite transporter family protein [Anaerococcus lactolyticus]EEI85697.1 formate/nitrite transporter [Anaerococcus lactolyticus ATCC 51172]